MARLAALSCKSSQKYVAACLNKRHEGMVIGFTRGGYERNPGRGRAEKNGEAVESGEKGKEEEDEGKGEMEAEK